MTCNGALHHPKATGCACLQGKAFWPLSFSLYNGRRQQCPQEKAIIVEGMFEYSMLSGAV